MTPTEQICIEFRRAVYNRVLFHMQEEDDEIRATELAEKESPEIMDRLVSPFHMVKGIGFCWLYLKYRIHDCSYYQAVVINRG